MRATIRLCAILGAASVACSLCGSTWRPPIRSDSSPAQSALHEEALRLYNAGEYLRAREVFHAAASRAESEGSLRRAAVDWNDAGAAALARQDYRNALPDFLKAQRMAERYGLTGPLVMALGNLAALQLQLGDYAVALRVAEEGLSVSNGTKDLATLAKLRFQLASAIVRVRSFNEAEPVYREAIKEIEDQGDVDTASRMLGNFGFQCLGAGRPGEAEVALTESLRLARLHQLNTSDYSLRALAILRAHQGDFRSAAALFDAAVEAPPGMTQRWSILTDRGEFRLGRNDLRGAMADFRDARRIATQTRADVVPADHERVAMESGLNRIDAGLIEAGNRLARETDDTSILRETFEAAEQDRRWSLRALDPGTNDWRSHLPDAYWDVLARYQAAERAMIAKSTPEPARRTFALERELEEMEAIAGRASHENGKNESALAHAARSLERGEVLFSFHIGQANGWLWAVDSQGVKVYQIPAAAALNSAVRDFTRAVQTGESSAAPRGARLYGLLFGGVSNRFLSAKRWLLELDGSLFDLPFGALVAETRNDEPVFLLERTVLETVPGALMLQRRAPIGEGEFLGVGDPIYNAADGRYEGKRNKPGLGLPRLAATGEELRACARAWNPARTRILTGAEAGIEPVRVALRARPSVIHFATHVVKGPENHASGLIALSLDRSGKMGLLDPKEIVAQTVNASLIVLNGCHSAQGDALPGTGLMGLTRAWIAAGAHAVVATRWDIPDEEGASLMVRFYVAMRTDPGRDPARALRQAQLEYLKSEVSRGNFPGKALSVAGAYFLLGRG